MTHCMCMSFCVNVVLIITACLSPIYVSILANCFTLTHVHFQYMVKCGKKQNVEEGTKAEVSFLKSVFY